MTDKGHNAPTPPITARTGAEIASFAEGLDVPEPGTVSCSRRRTAQGAAARPGRRPRAAQSSSAVITCLTRV